jgi:regulator of RNase E activity RraB
MSRPSKAVLRLPIEKRAEIAFKIAVAKAIDEHARLGLPIYIWRNGRVVELSPDEVRNISEPNGK